MGSIYSVTQEDIDAVNEAIREATEMKTVKNS